MLFVVPLNEPYDCIVQASQTALKTKLNTRKNIKKLACVYPSGVLAIAAYVGKHLPGAEIRILDLNVVINRLAERGAGSLDTTRLEDFLEEAFGLVTFAPDIVGISALFTSVYRDLQPLTAFLRRRFPGGLLVCGGHLASTLFERIYRDGIGLDAVAFGEGEIPMLELAGAVRAGTPADYLAASPCWVTREKALRDGGFTPGNSLIDDLDEIPPYDFDHLLFPEAYFDSSSFLFMPEVRESLKEMILFSTRGCPNRCVFCASHQVHGRKIRSFSVERIKRDAEYYHARHGITKFVFYDDHFLCRKQRALEILEHLPRCGFVTSIINPAFFAIDAEIAQAMKRAGVRSVFLSIESGNADTFKNIIHKPSSLAKANEAVEHLHRAGINAATNVLIGLPGETPESIDAGLEYLLTTRFDWFSCFVVAPLPGSELYAICKEHGYFLTSDEILTMDFKRCVIRTPEFTPQYIERKAYEMNLLLNFVHNPNMRAGNYETALMLFEKVIATVIDTHAFAHYCAARCCRALGREEDYRRYRASYAELIERHPFWKEYAVQFGLESLP